MSSRLRWSGPSGLTNMYAVLLQGNGNSWYNFSTPGYESYNAANFASYGIALVEFGSSGIYQATLDENIGAGLHAPFARQKAGASFAQGDLNFGQGELQIDEAGATFDLNSLE